MINGTFIDILYVWVAITLAKTNNQLQILENENNWPRLQAHAQPKAIKIAPTWWLRVLESSLASIQLSLWLIIINNNNNHLLREATKKKSKKTSQQVWTISKNGETPPPLPLFHNNFSRFRNLKIDVFCNY